MDYELLRWALLPDLVVVIGVFVALGLDYGWLHNRTLSKRNAIISNLVSWSLFLGLVGMLFQGMSTSEFNFADGQLVFSPMRYAWKASLFAMAILVVQLSSREPVCGQVSEYYALLLLATLGMGIVVTTENLLGAFVALELVSLSLYALTALLRRNRPSAEAALKYFTFGGVSSAFLLLGLSYIYGMTGSLEMRSVMAYFSSMPALPPLLLVGWLLVLVGLGFKIAVAPFHAWAPDVYQNAPTPVAAWIATGSKIAAIVLLVTLLKPAIAPQGEATLLLSSGVSQSGLEPDKLPGAMAELRLSLGVALSGLAVVAMIGGNLAALRETNLKRLLAYSAIANAGYLLVGLVAFSNDGRAASLFYVLVYSMATLGAFSVVSIIGGRLGRDAEIDDFRGCWKTMPGLAIMMFFFILSLAGIPPLAGFIGKYYLFFAVVQSHADISSWSEGWYWLVALALVMSVVSLYYYLKVLKAFLIFDEEARPEIDINPVVRMALIILVLGMVGLGLYPQPVLDIFIAAS